MAVPKRRKSKSRKGHRRSQNSKPPRVALSICPKCSEPKRPHCVCANCGTYKDRDILELEAKQHGA